MPNNIINKILVIFAHPAFEKSKVNLELCKAVKDLEGVTFRDLYEIYPDFLIDVKEEQKLLLEHDVIVLQHPFYWYSCPALMKEWIDLVLEYGFAYGHGGSALVGKLMMNAITTGGSEESYSQQGVHYYNVGEFLKVFERTAALCGMNYIPPFVVHQSSDLKSHEDISVYSDLYQKVILTLRDTTLDIRSLSEFQYINEYILDQFESWSV